MSHLQIMRNPTNWLCSVGCALLGIHTIAAADDHGLEHSFLEALPVVLSASRLPTPLGETPASVTVIDEALIRATGYRDLARLLRLVPGMQVGQARGHRHLVTYHGFALEHPNQMQVLIDGRPAHLPNDHSGADWSALPLAIEDIERIEVVRGPNAASYGTSAFLGIINIITRHTRAEVGSSVGVTAGSHGTRDAIARGVHQGDSLGIRATAQHQRDDGFSALSDTRELTRANLRADLQLGLIDELTVSAGATHGRRGEGFAGTRFEVEGLRNGLQDTSVVDVQWRRAPDARQELLIALSHQRERYREGWFGRGSFFDGINTVELTVPANNDRDTRRTELRLQHRFTPAPGLRTLWGAEWRHDRMAAPFLFRDLGEHDRAEHRLFGSAEWRAAPQWLWHAGAMAERIEGDRMRLAPRVALNWQAVPGQTWRAGYSRAFRQPSIFERNSDVQIRLGPQFGDLLLARRHRPNPEVRPQRVDAFELGYFAELPGARGLFDARLFQERSIDMIRRSAVPHDPLPPQIEALLPGVQAALGSTQWANIPDAVRLTGLEYQLRIVPWSDGELIFNHAILRARSRDSQLARPVAPHTASLTWLQRAGAWESALTVLHMERSRLGNGFSPNDRSTLPAYTTLDASLALNLSAGPRPTTLRLAGVNLLGRHLEVSDRALRRLSDDPPSTKAQRQIHLSLSMTL